jgi:hypothetical protein
MHMLYLSQCSNHVTSSALEQVLFAIHMHAPWFIRLQRPDQNNTYIYIYRSQSANNVHYIYYFYKHLYMEQKDVCQHGKKAIFVCTHLTCACLSSRGTIIS